MAEIKSESVADFIPESVAGLLRNQHHFSYFSTQVAPTAQEWSIFEHGAEIKQTVWKHWLRGAGYINAPRCAD
jgi:hypothetical protein